VTNSYYKISLDIQDHSSNVLVRTKKGDTGRMLLITLTDGRNPYAITEECRAVFAAKKADGNILYNACSIVGNVIAYEFTAQTTCVAGRADCEIKLYGADDKLLTSAQFALMVVDTVYNEGDEVESEKEVSALTALVSETIELIEDVEDKVESGAFRGDPGVYILAEGETLDDAPADAMVVIDPNGEVDPDGPAPVASPASIADISLPAAAWVGSENLYSQVVDVPGVTKYSQVDLTPSVELLAVFYNKSIAFVAENEDGVVTVYAIGQKPEHDYTIQATITEVSV
jgi:hypothetical protein